MRNRNQTWAQFHLTIHQKWFSKKGNQNEYGKGNYFVACSGLFKLKNRPADDSVRVRGHCIAVCFEKFPVE